MTARLDRYSGKFAARWAWSTLAALMVPAPMQASASDLEVAPGVVQVGLIQHKGITESSGVVASRRHQGVFWTHNDKGSRARLFAIKRDGKSLRDYRVEAALYDWEDIAIDGEGHLFLGDIGNNNENRTEPTVYQVDEPDPKSDNVLVTPTRTWRLRFPAEPFDCESLFVYQGHGYMISKVFKDAKAEMYRFSLTETKQPLALALVTRLPIDSPVTGADISADGRLLGVVSKSGAYVFRLDGDPAKAGQIKPYRNKFKHPHIEGCCFVPEGLLATAESREIFLFNDPLFRPEQ